MNGRLSLVRVLCYQVEISATGRSLVQRNPTASGLSERDGEASIMRRPWPSRGQVRHGEKNTQCNSSHSRLPNWNVSRQSYPSSLAITYTTLSPIFILLSPRARLAQHKERPTSARTEIATGPVRVLLLRARSTDLDKRGERNFPLSCNPEISVQLKHSQTKSDVNDAFETPTVFSYGVARFVIFGLLSHLHTLHTYSWRPLNVMSKRPVAQQKARFFAHIAVTHRAKKEKVTTKQCHKNNSDTHMAGTRAAMLWAKWVYFPQEEWEIR